VEESLPFRRHGGNKIPVAWRDKKVRAEPTKCWNEKIEAEHTKSSEAGKTQTMI
jgi:hypothetical protein